MGKGKYDDPGQGLESEKPETQTPSSKTVCLVVREQTDTAVPDQRKESMDYQVNGFELQPFHGMN